MSDTPEAVKAALEWLDRRELVFAKAPLNHASTIKAMLRRSSSLGEGDVIKRIANTTPPVQGETEVERLKRALEIAQQAMDDISSKMADARAGRINVRMEDWQPVLDRAYEFVTASLLSGE